MSSAPEPIDVVDHLAGIAPGTPLDALRHRRPQARTNAQATYAALFEPAEPGAFTRPERRSVARFVAQLHHQPGIAAFYGASGIAAFSGDSGVPAPTADGPYGHYPPGVLTAEDQPGPDWRVPPDLRATLGPRLAAAFEHAHLLVLHPRDARPIALQALLDAGWAEDGIVTLSQLVAFLSYQIRAVAGLRTLADMAPRA